MRAESRSFHLLVLALTVSAAIWGFIVVLARALIRAVS